MIYHFPLHRQHDLIQRYADTLEMKHGEEANIYWRSEMQSLAITLQKRGATAQEISCQITAFNDAVQLEIQKRWSSSRHTS